MPRRPATTVLLITRHLIARADFARDGGLIDLWTQPRPDIAEWPALAEIALELGPKAGRDTFILCTELWIQTLTLTDISTKKMAPEDIAAALNFEAETLSGQSAFESLVGFKEAGDKDYWIVQPRSADLQDAERIVQEAGSRLAGLAHPGGLPCPLSSLATSSGRAEAGSPWSRIEFWPDAVLFLRGDAAGKMHVQVVNADPQTRKTERWTMDWEAWRGAGAPTGHEALIAPGLSVSAPNLSHAVALGQEAELSRWLIAWAKHLRGKAVAAPLVRPLKKPMSTGQRWAIGVGLAALVFAACGSMHYRFTATIASCSAELQQIQAKVKQLQEAQKNIDDLKAKQKDLQGQIDGMDTSLKVLATHRLRLSRFLTKMSELYPEHLYVEKIEIDGGEPRLRGHCLQPELADRFANQLAQALTEQGWELSPSSKVALKKADDGAPWSFDIQFVSAKEMKLETRIDPKKGRGK